MVAAVLHFLRNGNGCRLQEQVHWVTHKGHLGPRRIIVFVQMSFNVRSDCKVRSLWTALIFVLKMMKRWYYEIQVFPGSRTAENASSQKDVIDYKGSKTAAAAWGRHMLSCRATNAFLHFFKGCKLQVFMFWYFYIFQLMKSWLFEFPRAQKVDFFKVPKGKKLIFWSSQYAKLIFCNSAATEKWFFGFAAPRKVNFSIFPWILWF